MIESGTARQLLGLILHVEERVTRLLTSGWRQARAEAADFQQDADALSEAGLPELGARVAAVAGAADAASALQAIALASSSCRLLRARLLVSEPPDGWQQIRPPKPRKRTTEDTILPLARLQVDGREVWACSWPARSQVVLLEPPLPELPAVTDDSTDAGALMARFQRQLERVFSDAKEDSPGSVWLRQPLRGSLRWSGRHPVGAAGEIALYTLEGGEWLTGTEGVEHQQLRAFRKSLARGKLQDNTTLSWSISGLRVSFLDQRDWQSYTWLDQSAATAFGQHADSTPWSLVWHSDQVIMPLALLVSGTDRRQPRIIHLVPGLPADVVSTAS